MLRDRLGLRSRVRMERIMRIRAGRSFSTSTELFLTAAGVLTLAAFAFIGTLTATRLSAQSSTQALANQSLVASGDRLTFDVASIKPNKADNNSCTGCMKAQPGGRFVYTNFPLRNLIATAYAPGQRRTIGDPKWDGLLSERFDIEAKTESNPTREQALLMLQSLLVDRFKLVAHFETRPLPIYALVLSNPGKTGPRLTPHSDEVKCIPVGPAQQGFGEFPTPWCGGLRMAPVPGGFRQIGNKINMDVFVALLMPRLDRLVLDRTGLSGSFDSDFEYASTPGAGAILPPSVDAPDPSAPPSIFTAMQEQLGLKLDARTEPVYVLVVDHVEEPSPN
jgi:uncharacterized protein (TIGR03435 family)